MRLKILVSYFSAGLILLLVVFADSHSQWLFLCVLFFIVNLHLLEVFLRIFQSERLKVFNHVFF